MSLSAAQNSTTTFRPLLLRPLQHVFPSCPPLPDKVLQSLLPLQGLGLLQEESATSEQVILVPALSRHAQHGGFQLAVPPVGAP